MNLAEAFTDSIALRETWDLEHATETAQVGEVADTAKRVIEVRQSLDELRHSGDTNILYFPLDTARKPHNSPLFVFSLYHKPNVLIGDRPVEQLEITSSASQLVLQGELEGNPDWRAFLYLRQLKLPLFGQSPIPLEPPIMTVPALTEHNWYELGKQVLRGHAHSLSDRLQLLR